METLPFPSLCLGDEEGEKLKSYCALNYSGLANAFEDDDEDIFFRMLKKMLMK